MGYNSSEHAKVFVSYSHKDQKYLERLQVHLKDLERKGIIDLWSDTKIIPGTNWREEIKRAIESATIGVLLVSADFLASQFIAEDELPPLLKVARTRGTVILPVILSKSRALHAHIRARLDSYLVLPLQIKANASQLGTGPP